jgi:hypothetical protein
MALGRPLKMPPIVPAPPPELVSLTLNVSFPKMPDSP